MSGKLTALLMLAFAAVCASTSIDNIDIPCDDTCSPECIIGLQDFEITHVCGQPAGDTPPTLPGECTASGNERCLTCIIETSCASTSPGPDICADTSKGCEKKKCNKYLKNANKWLKNAKCKKTCGLCGLIPSPELGSGPDICADTSKKCKKKKCKKWEESKIYKCKKTCGWCEPSQSPVVLGATNLCRLAAIAVASLLSDYYNSPKKPVV